MGLGGMTRSGRKINFTVGLQDFYSQINSLLLAPVSLPYELISQHSRENSFVHAEFRKDELEFVSVAVVTDQLGRWNRFHAVGQVSINDARCVAVPPMSERDHVGKDPGVANQFLIGDARKYGNGEVDRREGIEEMAVFVK